MPHGWLLGQPDDSKPRMNCISPRSAARTMNSSAPLGRRSRIAAAAFALRLLRTITPALANVSVFCGGFTSASMIELSSLA